MKQQKSDASVTRVTMNLEVDVIPVSDVERSKQFYQLLGWRLDEDVAPAKNVRGAPAASDAAFASAAAHISNQDTYRIVTFL
jgi:predicted enzyme related to lactoylglutathione lyase